MSQTAILLTIAAVLCWGAGAIFDKLAVQHLPPTVAFFARLYILFLIAFPFLLRGWHDHRSALAAAPRIVPFYLLLNVLFYFLGMFVYYHALSRAEASKVVPFSSAYPLVTFALAIAFLSEPFRWSKLAGVLLVVTGTTFLAR
jgi:transporter family protein